jgi:hypothetical protein
MKTRSIMFPPLLAIFGAVLGLSPLLAQEKPATSQPEKSKEGRPAKDKDLPEPAVAEATQGLGGFGKLLPLGQKNIDVKIPSFKDGRPSSLLRAGSMTRIDDENMLMEKLDIRLYGLQQDKDVRVQLITGTYHMPTQVLGSEQRSRISRADFEIEGDTMIFDTRTQQGKMTGNVQMIIFDSDSLMGATAEEPAPVEKTASPKPAGEATDAPIKNSAGKAQANEKK